MAKRELTYTEKLWCRRLARVLYARPQTLEIYVSLNTINILPAGSIDKALERFKSLYAIINDALYTITAKIIGDASG